MKGKETGENEMKRDEIKEDGINKKNLRNNGRERKCLVDKENAGKRDEKMS